MTRNELEARLASTEAEVENYLPLDERWSNAPSVVARTNGIREVLDDVFVQTTQGSFELECRGRVCKVESDVPSSEWLSRIATTKSARGIFGQVQVGSDDSNAVYLELADTSRAAANELVLSAIDAFMTSSTVAACKRDATVAGVVALIPRFDSARRMFDVAATGQAAKLPVATCLAQALERTLRVLVIPADVVELSVRTVEIDVP